MIFSMNLAVFLLSSLFLLVLMYSSFRENEVRAALIILLGFNGNLMIWMTFILFGHLIWVSHLNFAIIGFIFFFVLISWLRFFPDNPIQSEERIIQFDERDHMFSRNNLKFHQHLFKKYYELHPDKKDDDQKLQRKPELGDTSQMFYDPLNSPIFNAVFTFLNKIKPYSRGKTASEKKVVRPEDITRIINNIAIQYGAIDVGIIGLKSHHLYSHAGRHADIWGKAINNHHQFAIVIVVAMDEKMIRRAPALPVILESAHQYMEAAKIACIIAEYLRLLGYASTAHTDGNYETLCVPLAVDSGLGELGRLGILIHHRHGPCVRLSVVTTDVELVPTKKKRFQIHSFCRICKKCARNCPSKAITDGEEQSSRGIFHWSIKQEKCFAFWKKAGTDCGICIRVCPYTKPNTFFHRLVRLYVSRNPINQRIALFFDDLLYGKQISIPKKNPKNLY
jgi:reductive dehalogenase